MDRQESAQLELFSQSGEVTRQRNPGFSFLTSIRDYEKAILFIFGFIVIGIISFSLGVEKGKETSASKSNAAVLVAPVQNVPVKVYPTAIAPSVKPEQNTIRRQPIAPAAMPLYQHNYVIQIASYKNRVQAQTEADFLKKRGFQSLVLNKGSYLIVCVGNFSSEKGAQSQLSELKKRYRDCYVRRL